MQGLEIAKQTVMLMGASFLVGSLFTIFVLLILEMLRSAREAREQLWEETTAEELAEMERDATDRIA